MDSDKRAYLDVLEQRKKNINETLKELEKKGPGIFGSNERRAAQLKGEVNKIDETINRINSSSEDVEIGSIGGFFINRIDKRLERNSDKQDEVRNRITELDNSLANARTKTAKRIISRMKKNKAEQLQKLQKKETRLKGRQRSFAAPTVFLDNYRKFRIGHNEGMAELRRDQAEDAAILAHTYNDGSIIGSIRSAYYEVRGALYKQSQLRYQNIVDKLKSRVVKVKGAREIDIPRVLSPVLS